MVTRLIIVSILAHGQGAELHHFMDHLAITAHAESRRDRKQLMQFAQQLIFASVQLDERVQGPWGE